MARKGKANSSKKIDINFNVVSGKWLKTGDYLNFLRHDDCNSGKNLLTSFFV